MSSNTIPTTYSELNRFVLNSDMDSLSTILNTKETQTLFLANVNRNLGANLPGHSLLFAERALEALHPQNLDSAKDLSPIISFLNTHRSNRKEEILSKLYLKAIENNANNTIKEALVSQGATVDYAIQISINSMIQTRTPLQTAIANNDLEKAKRLTDHGADIHVLDPFGYSLLHYAYGNPQMVEFLLQRGLNPNLHTTAEIGVFEFDLQLDDLEQRYANSYAHTIANQASRKDLDRSLLLLINAGLDLKADYRWDDPLSQACFKGLLDAAREMILNRGVPVLKSAPERYGFKSPLEHAIHGTLVDFWLSDDLLEFAPPGAILDMHTGRRFATEYLDLINLLLDHGADIMETYNNPFGNTRAFYIACGTPFSELAVRLMQMEAELEIGNDLTNEQRDMEVVTHVSPLTYAMLGIETYNNPITFIALAENGVTIDLPFISSLEGNNIQRFNQLFPQLSPRIQASVRAILQRATPRELPNKDLFNLN